MSAPGPSTRTSKRQEASTTITLPPGTYEFNTLSLPQGVVLQGVEVGGTVLRSTQTQAVVTIAGNRAGLADLTLDGVNLGVGSIGVVADGRTDMILRDVIVKLNDGLDDAKREHDGGAVTDEQMETFWALLKYTTGLS